MSMPVAAIAEISRDIFSCQRTTRRSAAVTLYMHNTSPYDGNLHRQLAGPAVDAFQVTRSATPATRIDAAKLSPNASIRSPGRALRIHQID